MSKAICVFQCLGQKEMVVELIKPAAEQVNCSYHMRTPLLTSYVFIFLFVGLRSNNMIVICDSEEFREFSFMIR